MLRAVTQDRFIDDPRGCYVAGPSWLYWCMHPGLLGVSFWGSPRGDELAPLLALHRAALDPSRPQHGCLVDTRHLDHLDPDALAVIVSHIGRELDGLRKQTRAQALLRGGGMPGMTIAGLQSVLALPYPASVFVDPVEALRWLGFVNAPELLGALEPVIESARSGADVLRRLRVLLDETNSQAEVQHVPANLSLAQAARALAVAPRTLQRRLQEAHTTFHAELTGARVRAAATLLRDPSLTLAAVARRLGCSNAAQFSARFRRATSESPSRFRARRRELAASRAA